MKNPRRTNWSTLLPILGLSLFIVSAQAQDVGFPDNWTCASDHYWKNVSTGFKATPVDLDHDGKVDFRFVSQSASAADPNHPLGDPLYSFFEDSTLAYFAERHVQVYLRPSIDGCALNKPAAVLAPGTLIPARPAATNSWQWTNPYNVPSLKGIGFGYTGRHQYFMDPHIRGGSWEPGYLQLDSTRILTNALFGFRLQSSDGWHTGWMRIRWAPTVYTIDSVKMIEYAVNPIPDTDIVAGVHVGAPLQIATGGTNSTSLRISWPTTATNVVLETKPDLGATNWVTVQGVTNNEVVLQPTNATSFYRLSGQKP